jgi:hypothetical protein
MNQELNENIKEIEKNWLNLQLSVKNYREFLSKLSTYSKLNEEIELWISQKIQITNELIISNKECIEINELEFINNKIDQNINEINQYCDTKVKYLTDLAIKIYGIFLLIIVKFLKQYKILFLFFINQIS